jgi:pimeloyl-ACP methyl ester carboxylesterase
MLFNSTAIGSRPLLLPRKNRLSRPSFVLTAIKVAILFALQSCGLGSTSALKSNWNAAHCSGGTVKVVDVPVDHGDPSKGTFKYRFQFRQATDAAKWPYAIMYVPGGPGGSGMAQAILNSIPANAGAVQFDPRGVGCNYNDGKLKGYLSTDQHIRDMALAIKSVEGQIGSGYIIYGVSYGTLASTKLVHHIEQTQVAPTPRALVLDSVLADSAGASGSTGRMVNLWNSNNVRSYLTGIIGNMEARAEMLRTLPGAEARIDEFFVSPDLWSAFIRRAMQGNNQVLFQLSDVLSDQGDLGKEVIEGYINEFLEYSNDDPPGSTDVYAEVTCKEITSKTGEESYLQIEGSRAREVSSGIEPFCRGVALSQPYNVSNHVLERTPIYYLQGKDDPVTTYNQFIKHWQAQTKMRHHHTIITAGSHSAMKGFSPRCLETYWQGVQGLKKEFNLKIDAFGHCQ